MTLEARRDLRSWSKDCVDRKNSWNSDFISRPKNHHNSRVGAHVLWALVRSEPAGILVSSMSTQLLLPCQAL